MKTITIATRTVQNDNKLKTGYAVVTTEGDSDSSSHPVISCNTGIITTARDAIANIRVLGALLEATPVGKATIRLSHNWALEAVTEYLPVWRENGFVGTNNCPIKCVELWKRVDALIQQNELTFDTTFAEWGSTVGERQARSVSMQLVGLYPPEAIAWEDAMRDDADNNQIGIAAWDDLSPSEKESIGYGIYIRTSSVYKHLGQKTSFHLSASKGGESIYWKEGESAEDEDIIPIKLLVAALSNTSVRSAIIEITDASAVKAIGEYLPVWREYGFVGTNNRPIRHAATWKQLDEFIQSGDFSFYLAGGPGAVAADTVCMQHWDDEAPAKDE